MSYLQKLRQKRARLSVLKAEANKELAQLKGSPTAACEGSMVSGDCDGMEDVVSVVSEERDAVQDMASVPDMKVRLPFAVPAAWWASLSLHKCMLVGNAMLCGLGSAH